MAVAWLAGLIGVSSVVAALAVLVIGLATGRSRPAWLRFVGWARMAGTLLGGALVVVGLLHYRNTEPRGEIHWIMLELVVVTGAVIIHWWVIRTRRQLL